MDGKERDDSLMEQFTCPICFEYMDAKIYICSNGHSLCGKCNSRVSTCPICKVKLNAKRNIAMEKAARKIKEWKAKQDILPIYSVPSKRKHRFSLGSPLPNKPCGVDNNQIQCPLAKCCFSTKNLLQLRIHLHTWHRDRLYAIKKGPTVTSEDLMRIRLYWPVNSFHNMFIITASDVSFIIYIVRTPDYVKNSTHYVNALTVSNETKMYKFSCGSFTKFSNFYQGRHQAQDGVEVDDGSIETVCRKGAYCYLLKILISKVASLFTQD